MIPERSRAFASAYAQAGKKLDLGKSSLRFRSLEELCDAAIRQAMANLPVDRFIADYEATRSGSSSSA